MTSMHLAMALFLGTEEPVLQFREIAHNSALLFNTVSTNNKLCRKSYLTAIQSLMSLEHVCNIIITGSWSLLTDH